MQVPCSMPLAEPWSPVGYHVVPLPEVDVVAGQPSETPRAQLAPAGSHGLPCSPVGYQVLLVKEEQLPPTPRVQRSKKNDTHSLRKGAGRPRPRSSGMAIWLPMVVVALVGVPVSLVMAMAASQRTAVRANMAPPAEGIAVAAAPAEADDLGVVAAGLEGDDAAGCEARPGAERFGTAVNFERNPAEAARIAGEQRKLTFVIHVSGNFDEPGFT